MATQKRARTRRSSTRWPHPTGATQRYLALVPVALILIACALLLERAFPVDTLAPAPVAAPPAVRINEVMSQNRSALADDKGHYADWVELINDSTSPVDVSGWTLKDGFDRLVGFTFPNQILAPQEIVLIYATGTLKNVSGYPYHAPFKISASGDELVLSDASGALVDQLSVPALSGNESYARSSSGAFVRTIESTPGLANTRSNHQALVSTTDPAAGALVINELISANVSYGDAHPAYGRGDLIELINRGDAPVDLTGYTLSDDESRPGKWRIGGDYNTVVAPGGVFLIAASGAPDVTDAPHASFKLSSAGETVVLSDPSGRMVDRVTCPPLDADRAYARMTGDTFTADYPPTPGYANDANGLAALDQALTAANPVKLYLSEAIASSRKPNSTKASVDWIELVNQGSSPLDLTGYGLSDDPSQPRKWQFPSGSTIAPGAYLVVTASGVNKSAPAKDQYQADFKISLARGETLTLSTPDGRIIDRLPMLGQRSGVSFGRLPNAPGYQYLSEPSRGAQNAGTAYAGRAEDPVIAPAGGLTKGPVTVTLTAAPGTSIHYTLDCSEPSETSPVYTAPIPVSETTVVRARAYGPGLLPSMTATSSYLFGTAHTLPVISLVSDPSYLFDGQIGIYSEGPKPLKYPYKGANFFKDWERAANVEMFTGSGATVLSQGAGLSLQGQYSRMEKQKAFKITARGAYGPARFEASLFPNRPYTSYKSFLLRSSGQDTAKTRLRDAVLVTLADQTSVQYQDTAPVVVYLNGQYWGHYNMRERIHKYAIAQWEGLTDVDSIDIVKANSTVKKGTNEDYAQFLTWLKKNGCVSEANLARVREMVDVENYLDYVAVEMYIGNTDLLNVKRYRSQEGDNRWRWVLFDTDWAFNTDTDSYRRWLDKDGAGSGKKTDNTLFVQLMKNPDIKRQFLTRFGQLMHISWRSDLVIRKIDAFAAILEPEMEMQTARWGGSVKRWRNSVNELRDYAKERPRKMLGYIKKELGFTNAQLREYFGDIMDDLGI